MYEATALSPEARIYATVYEVRDGASTMNALRSYFGTAESKRCLLDPLDPYRMGSDIRVKSLDTVVDDQLSAVLRIGSDMGGDKQSDGLWIIKRVGNYLVSVVGPNGQWAMPDAVRQPVVGITEALANAASH